MNHVITRRQIHSVTVIEGYFAINSHSDGLGKACVVHMEKGIRS
jgi:hypothetical protein